VNHIYRSRAVDRAVRQTSIGLLLAVLAACGNSNTNEQSAAEETDHEGLVRLTAEQVAAAGIEIAETTLQSVTDVIEATAIIEAAADRVARIGSRVSGRVMQVLVNVGDTVQPGQIVALIDSPELGRAKADYLAALAEADVAREVADRERALLQERITSQREWRQAEAQATRARAEKDATENALHALGLSDDDLEGLEAESHYSSLLEIRTLLRGIVVGRDASLGAMIEPQDVLFTVMDLREVWTQIDVYDQDLARVHMGQRVRATVRPHPDRVFEGRIDNIGAVVEPETRAVRVRVALPNAAGLLLPGMFADVEIEVGVSADSAVLVLPTNAVQRDQGDFVVFVQHGVGEFERRLVEIEATLRDHVVIRAGLLPGEIVVTNGAFVLKSEFRKGELGEGHGH
jgi:membrane fusion protein, heavy metal efflux system